METVVQIEGVESKSITTRRGPGTVYNVEASDGNRYSTFDKDKANRAAELRGQTVTIEYKTREWSKDGKSGVNYDLEGIAPAPGVGGIVITPSVVSGSDVQSVYVAHPAIQTQDKKDISIARAVALKASVDTATGLQFVDASAGVILQIANEYVDWLLNGPTTKTVEVEDHQTSDPGDATDASQADGILVNF